MAPSTSKAAQQSTEFEADEKCLCFHGEYLYEAKILMKAPADPADKKSPWKYKVHYKGWKNTWDDWVDVDRLRKLNDENKDFAKSLFADLRQKQREEREAKEASKKPSIAGGSHHSKKKSGLGSELGSFRGSEERSSSAQAPMRGTKRARDWEIEKEETFATRPSIRMPLPDHLKGLLVDDWENVTKSLLLVPLPHPHPVSQILADYSASEAPKRRPGSADADVLEEVIQGVKEYFDKSLGRILLYRVERQQWLELHERMSRDPAEASAAAIARTNVDGNGNGNINTNSNTHAGATANGRPKAKQPKASKTATASTATSAEPKEPSATPAPAPAAPASSSTHQDQDSDPSEDLPIAGKTPSDVYGAEHLCRLFVSMPELIAQTNMDAQSVGRLREELAKMTAWLAKNTSAYFARCYVDPGAEYMEKAKGTG